MIVSLLVASTLIAPDPGEPPPIPTPTPVPPVVAPLPIPPLSALEPCAEVVSLDIEDPSFTPAVEWAMAEWNAYLGCIGLNLGDGIPIGWARTRPDPIYTTLIVAGLPAAPPWEVTGVYLNPDTFDPKIHFLPCAFAHEFGHVLQLNENEGPSIMDASYWAGRIVSSCDVH